MKPSNWSSWFGAALLPALLAAAELAWAYLWLAWFCALPFADFGHTALSWPTAAVVLSLALLSTRLLLGRVAPGNRGDAEDAEPARRTDNAEPTSTARSTARSASPRFSRLWLVGWGDRGAAIGLLVAGAVVASVITWVEYGRPLFRAADLVQLPDRLAVAPAADTALLFAAYLWWRGISIARNRLHFDDANVRFVVGLIALTAVLALMGATGATLSRTATALLVLQFFACSLLALALARLEDIRGGGFAETGLAISREWLGVLGLTVVAILTGALILTATVSEDIGRALAAALNLAADGLIIALYVIALPLGLMITVLIYAMRALIRLLGGGSPEPFQPPPSLADIQNELQTGQDHHLPLPLLTLGKWAMLAAVVVVVAVVIVRAVFRYRHRRDDEVDELHESLWPSGSLLSLLRAWLRRLLDRIRRRRPAPDAAVATPIEGPIGPEAATVRAMYRSWLQAAADLGRPRRTGETPDEFMVAGRVLLPGLDDEIAALTHAYERARYGPPPAPAPAVESAGTAWRHIHDRLPAPPPGHQEGSR